MAVEVAEGEMVGVGVVVSEVTSVWEARRTSEFEVSKVELGTMEEGRPERAVFAEVLASAVVEGLGDAVVDLGVGFGVDESTRMEVGAGSRPEVE